MFISFIYLAFTKQHESGKIFPFGSKKEFGYLSQIPKEPQGLLHICMVKCDILKYGDDFYGQKFCLLRQMLKMKANFKYFLIKPLVLYLWDVTLICSVAPAEGARYCLRLKKMKDPVPSWREGAFLLLGQSVWKRFRKDAYNSHTKSNSFQLVGAKTSPIT